jgi:hypothetical protein
LISSFGRVSMLRKDKILINCCENHNFEKNHKPWAIKVAADETVRYLT